MLASFPASMVNQSSPDLGIPNRLRLKSSRSSAHRHRPWRAVKPYTNLFSNALQSKQWCEVRLRSDAGDRKHQARVIAKDPVMAEQCGEHDLRLGHGKCRADADAWP